MWTELGSSLGIFIMTILFIPYRSDGEIPPEQVKFWGCCCMLKFLRLIVYLSTFKQIGLTINVFFQLIPFLKTFLGMLLIIFFIFATIGINIFGGRVSNKTPNIFKEKTGLDLGTNYNYINFNDVPNAILALYINVINNNWIYFMNMFILDAEDGLSDYRWYFVVFQLITNLFVMTILVGFIIDNILKQFEAILEKEKEEKEEIERIRKEQLGIVDEVKVTAKDRFKTALEKIKQRKLDEQMANLQNQTILDCKHDLEVEDEVSRVTDLFSAINLDGFKGMEADGEEDGSSSD